jgi:hypothetical protein
MCGQQACRNRTQLLGTVPEQGVGKDATHPVTDAAECYSKASEVIAQGYVEGL